MARYPITVRYSNDNVGPTETVAVSVDGAGLGQFEPADTGDGGQGWNVFATATLGPTTLSPGHHTLVVAVSGGDGYGVEIDSITLDQV